MASSSFTALEYGAGTKNRTKTYIMGGFELTRAEDWKALMATAYTLLTTNELLHTDFSGASAKETLKLIDDEFVNLISKYWTAFLAAGLKELLKV